MVTFGFVVTVVVPAAAAVLSVPQLVLGSNCMLHISSVVCLGGLLSQHGSTRVTG